MANLDKIKVGEETYDIQDSTARSIIQDLLAGGTFNDQITITSKPDERGWFYKTVITPYGVRSYVCGPNINDNSIIWEDPLPGGSYDFKDVLTPDKLSGNFKTINKESIVGEGDLSVGSKFYLHHITCNVNASGQPASEGADFYNVTIVSTKPDEYKTSVSSESEGYVITSVYGKSKHDGVFSELRVPFYNAKMSRWEATGNYYANGCDKSGNGVGDVTYFSDCLLPDLTGTGLGEFTDTVTQLN